LNLINFPESDEVGSRAIGGNADGISTGRKLRDRHSIVRTDLLRVFVAIEGAVKKEQSPIPE
jgi:hypothetical protein